MHVFLQAGDIIEMLMNASEQITSDSNVPKFRKRSPDNADTLLRILCHKKEKEASKFLKRHYQLPNSCGGFFLPSRLFLSVSCLHDEYFSCGHYFCPIHQLIIQVNAFILSNFIVSRIKMFNFPPKKAW